MKTNQIVRDCMKQHSMKNWQLADVLGIHENTVIRKFRHEMPENEQRELIRKIEVWAGKNS